MRRARRRPGENRARLIEAGIIAFGGRGFDGTATSEVARIAEVPQPHVYQHFPSKSALFIECLTETCARLLSVGSRAPLEPGGGVATIAHGPKANEADLYRLLVQSLTQVGSLEHGPAVRNTLVQLRAELPADRWGELILHGAGLLLDR